MSANSIHANEGTALSTTADITAKTAMPDYSSSARRAVTWLAIIGACAISTLLMTPTFLAFWRQQPWMISVIKAHFAAIVGLPSAALVSLILVVILEAKFDQIDMEFKGIAHFRGASGPIILWALCFVVIAIAIKMLW